MKNILVVMMLAQATVAGAQDLTTEVDRRAAAVNDKVVTWRRDVHQHPELSNQEVRTAKLIADHLRALGMDVQTGVAHTGVVGVLKGGASGPVVARARRHDPLPAGRAVGERGSDPHHGERQTDAWREAVGGCGSDRCRVADRPRASDNREPPARHYEGARDREHRHDPGRRAQQHHSGQRDADWNRARARQRLTINDPALTAWAAPTIQRVAGEGKAMVGPAQLGAEDFSYFAREAPGFYFILGATPADTDMSSAASNHSPLFFVDEAVLPLGVRAMSHLAVDYLTSHRAVVQ